MKNALILHGSPLKEEYYNPNRSSQSNSHWIPWLQQELIIRDILTQTPELPKPFDPVYKDWFNLFENFEVNNKSILIGTSCGGGFLVRWLSESDIKIHKLILIAPWLDPEKTLQNDFFEFEIDKNLGQKAKEIHILFSVDDETEILDSVTTLRKEIEPHKYHEFKNHGHFCYSEMKTQEFPELLEIVLS